MISVATIVLKRMQWAAARFGQARRWFAFAAAGLVYVSLNVHWLINSSRLHVAMSPADWNEHFLIFSRLAQRFYFGSLHNTYIASEPWLYNLLQLSPNHPPAFYLTALLVKICAGWIAPETVLLTATFWMLIALWYVYRLAELLRQGSGSLTVWLSLLVPFVWLSARSFSPTTMLAAIGVAFLYYMLAYERCPRLRIAIALGICSGAGMMTDKTAVAMGMVLLGRLFVTVVRNHSAPSDRLQRLVKHMLVALAVACGIAAVFYYDRDNRDELALFLGNWVTIGWRDGFHGALLPYGIPAIRALGIAGVAGFAVAGMAFWRHKEQRRVLGWAIGILTLLFATVPAMGDRPAVLLMLVLLGIVSLASILKKSFRNIQTHHSVIALCVALLILIYQRPFFHRPFAYGTSGFKQAVQQLAASPGKVGYLSDMASQKYLVTLEQFFVLWGRHPVLVRDIPSSAREFYLMFHYFDGLVMVEDVDAEGAFSGETSRIGNWMMDKAHDNAERDYVKAILIRLDSTRPQFTAIGSYTIRPELLLEKPLLSARVWLRKSANR